MENVFESSNDGHGALEPELLLERAEAALVSARELLTVAEERIILAKQRVKFAEERQAQSQMQLGLAREIATTAKRLLRGAEELCRLGQQYIQLPRSEEWIASDVELLEKALASLTASNCSLAEEANRILALASSQELNLQSRMQSVFQEIEREQKHYRHEVGVWFNANELLNLAEDQLAIAQAHLHRAEDRVNRARDRVSRSADRRGRTHRSGPQDFDG